MNACIFLGPTLPLKDASAIFDALYLPPVQQGDVYRAVVRHRPRAIGIVDGYFEHVPSVWHKEILWALAQGVHVFGSASMGALRAAELGAFGMRGVGKIFEAYRTGIFEPYVDELFEDDDEVAIIHAATEGGYVAASEALVNIRSTLAAASQEGIITAGSRDVLVQAAKRLFYPERSWHTVLSAGAQHLRESEIEALRQWLPNGCINQKRADALSMLSLMRDFLAANPLATRVDYVFQRSEMWQRAIEAIDAGTYTNEQWLDREWLLDELRLAGTYAESLRAGVLRWAGLRECARQDNAENLEERRIADAAFRNRFAISSRKDIERWLAENDLDDAGRAQLISDESRLIQLAHNLRTQAADHIIAHLQVTGHYAHYAARARGKSKLLGHTGSVQVDAPMRLRLALWYFEQQLGESMPDDIEEYAVHQGFPDVDTLYRALWREYQYVVSGAPREPLQDDEALITVRANMRDS